MSGSTQMRVVIAGAGALGSSLALALARRGARVTLADPAPKVSASAVAAGMLAPVFESVLDDDTAIPFEILRASAALWTVLAGQIGLDLDRLGSMAVGATGDLDRWAARAVSLGAPCERLGRDEAEARVDGLRAPEGALFTPLDIRLDPRPALAALIRAAGVAVRPAGLVGFESGRAVFADADVVEADAVVVATGASTSLARLAPELTALGPIKGHILRLSGGPVDGPVVRMASGYVCPTSQGAVVGASMEPGRGDLCVDAAIVERLARQAFAALPDLEGMPIHPEVGVRAATADGWPLAGRSSTPGVWIAGGTRRNGWLLAPMIAEALAGALVADREPQLPAGFDPRRFAA